MTGNGNGNGNGAHPRRWSFARSKPRAEESDRGAFRRLALQLNFELTGAEARRSVLVVTPDVSELSASGSIILAECMAQELQRPILLVDAAPRDPQASRMLGCNGDRGFSDIETDPGLLDELILPTSTENLYFLPAGTNSSDRPSGDPKIILETLESRYDFVLFNGGSVLHHSAALASSPFVGRVLLLVAENRTRQKDLDAACQTLYHCKANNVGLVLTNQSSAKGRRDTPWARD